MGVFLSMRDLHHDHARSQLDDEESPRVLPAGLGRGRVLLGIAVAGCSFTCLARCSSAAGRHALRALSQEQFQLAYSSLV